VCFYFLTEGIVVPKIIICHRHTDSAGITGRIFDRFVQRYGKQSVICDIDESPLYAVPVGAELREWTQSTISGADVVIVIIGRNWIGGNDFGLNADFDPVRIEIEIALKLRIPLIPVLVNDADMPKVSELPESLKNLVYLNAATIDPGLDFNAH